MDLDDLIDQHWRYVSGILQAHAATDAEQRVAEFHYRTAFRHGWKHALEAAQSHVNSENSEFNDILLSLLSE